MHILRKRVADRSNNRCKSHEVKAFLTFPRNIEVSAGWREKGVKRKRGE